MAKEENKSKQEPNYDEVLASMSIEQKDNTIKQLDRQCSMLANENIKIKQQMQQIQQSEFYVVLDWNYKVATNTSDIFSNEFKTACAKRVEEMLTPIKENSDSNE